MVDDGVVDEDDPLGAGAVDPEAVEPEPPDGFGDSAGFAGSAGFPDPDPDGFDDPDPPDELLLAGVEDGPKIGMIRLIGTRSPR